MSTFKAYKSHMFAFIDIYLHKINQEDIYLIQLYKNIK